MRQKTLIITLILVFSIFSAVSAAELSDLSSDHWAYQAVNDLVKMGVLEGYPDGEFKGANELSRYEMAVIINRLHESLNLERENLGEDLTAKETAELEKIVEALIKENRGGEAELSDGQLEEIVTIVDALTLEYASELEVLGADLKLLKNDISSIERKLSELRLPEDKIEFSLEIGTYFETTDYPSTNEERALAVFTWTDEDVLDLESSKFFRDMDYADLYYSLLDFDNTFSNPNKFQLNLENFKGSDDINHIPTQKKLWQEYDFIINGQQSFGDFNLELNTIDNLFSEVDSVIPDYRQKEQKSLVLESALLEIDYHDNHFKIGDLDNYQIKPYFLAENDLEALEYKRQYKDIDWNFLTGGTEIALGVENFAVDIYSLGAAKEINSANYGFDFNQLRFEGQNLNNLALAADNFKVNDSLSLKGELVYNDWEVEKLVGSFTSELNMYYIGFEELLKSKKGDAYYLNLEADWQFSDQLKLKPRFQTAGKDFLAVENDLAAPYGFALYGFAADYSLSENLLLESSYAYIDPDSEWDNVFQSLIFADGVKPEAKEIYTLSLNQSYNKFTNSMGFEYEKNDNFFADFDQITLILKTIYQLDEKTQLGAKFVNKTGNWESRVINNSAEYKTEMEGGYNYLEAFINKKLSDNMSWNLTGRITDSHSSYKQNNIQGYDLEAVASMLETSLKVSF